MDILKTDQPRKPSFRMLRVKLTLCGKHAQHASCPILYDMWAYHDLYFLFMPDWAALWVIDGTHTYSDIPGFRISLIPSLPSPTFCLEVALCEPVVTFLLCSARWFLSGLPRSNGFFLTLRRPHARGPHCLLETVISWLNPLSWLNLLPPFVGSKKSLHLPLDGEPVFIAHLGTLDQILLRDGKPIFCSIL